MIRIILIRHGRTAWNPRESGDQGQRFRGLIDLPLTDEGVAQAQAVARRLLGTRLAAVYSSPLQRAAHTAQIIAEPHGLVAQSLPGLSSMDYGDWAGQLHADVAQRWPDLYRQWRHDPFSIPIPGGESTQDLRGRAIAAVHDALARHSDGETIALVSHQVVTRTLSCALVGLPNTSYWHIHQDLGNLSLFGYRPTGGQFDLLGLNDTCHLSPALPQARGRGTRILLIRHGQTAWNEGSGEERFRGRTDLPLDASGEAQARAVASRLRNEPLAALYASPLLRARQTIAPLALELERVGQLSGKDLKIEPHDGLLDIDYGRFQGLTHSEAAAAYPELYARWRTAPSQVRFPGGEGLADVQARLLALLHEIAARHPGETIALVGHQMVNKVLACTLLGLDMDQIWRVRQDTAAIDVFEQMDGAWHILCLNDSCHLA
jgi:broad specificity phosphatase PhoE